MVASDQQVMYWAPKRKRPLHSSAYRLILQWGRALRFDTARAISYLESSSLTAHAGLTRRAVSRPLVKGNEVAGYEGAARAVAVHRLSGHAISQLLSRNKSVVSAHAKVA